MKKDFSKDDWNKEYQYFLESDRSTPPSDVTAFIKRTLHDELNPPIWKVFCKLFAIHFIAGVITLFFCPQLGVTIHKENDFLLSFFSSFGSYGCMLACGAVFLGGTGLVAAFLLRTHEVRAIRKTPLLQWALLVFLSLGFFLSVGEVEHTIPASLIAAWSLGALLGGFFSFRLGWLLRGHVKNYLLS